MRFVLYFAMTLFLLGCAQKTSPFALNPSVLNTQGNLKERSIYTYEAKKSKITGYFFSRDSKTGQLQYTHMIVYIPIDYTGQLYDPFSNVTWALKRYTDGQASTLHEAFKKSALKNGNRPLFKTNKDAYIVDTQLAKNLLREIREFNRKIERQEERDDEELIIIP